MKLNLAMPPDSKQYADLARKQKKYAQELAGRIERSEPLNEMDREFAAGLLKFWADNLSETKPTDHHPPLYPWGEALLLHGMGWTVTALAERYGVSTRTIRENLKAIRTGTQPNG